MALQRKKPLEFYIYRNEVPYPLVPKKEIVEIDRISCELGVIQICIAMIHFLSHDCRMWDIYIYIKF